MISPKCSASKPNARSRRTESSHGGFGHGVSGLDHSRRGVRAQRRFPRRTRSTGATVYRRGPGQHHCVDHGSSVVRSENSGRGRVPSPPSRESVSWVAHVTSQLADREWHRLCVGQGAKGPLVFEFAAIRVWATRHGEAGASLLARGATVPGSGSRDQVLPEQRQAETPLWVMARVACTRHTIEDYLEDCKSYLGMGHYETRSWSGWHHHMTLVALAHLFVTLTRLQLKKKRRS